MDTNQKPSCTPKQLNKSFQNYDNVHRMNFLFELGKLTNKKYPLLSSFYSKNLKLISRKTQQRLDASIKHNLCKACNANLHSHPNMKIKLKKKHVYQTCPNCSNVKRFPCDIKQDRTEITKDDRVHEIFIGDASARQKKTEQSQQCHEGKKSNKKLNTAVGIVKEASTIAATDKEANTVAATGKEANTVAATGKEANTVAAKGKEANTVATTAEEDLKTRATSLKEENSIDTQTKASSNTRTTTSSEASSTLIVAINNEDTIAVATNKHQSNKVYANKEEGDDKMDTS